MEEIEEMIEITVYFAMTGNKITTVRLPLLGTVGFLRQAIAGSMNQDISMIQVQIDGRILEVDTTLQDAGLSDTNSVVNIVLAPPREWLDWTLFPIMAGLRFSRPDLKARCAGQTPDQDWNDFKKYHAIPLWGEDFDYMLGMRMNHVKDVENVERSYFRRRTVDFAMTAAIDREMRLQSLITQGPGICVGSVPKAPGIVPDAKWG